MFKLWRINVRYVCHEIAIATAKDFTRAVEARDCVAMRQVRSFMLDCYDSARVVASKGGN